MTTPVEAAARAVASMGVPLPDNLDELIGKLINPWAAEDVNARTHPDRLIAAWRATTNAQADEAVWIVLLMAFREEFAVKSDDLIAAIKATRMSPFGTRVEVDRQLGSRAFHLGRRLIEADPRSGPGRALLQLCVRILRGAVNRDERATDATLRMMHGQIATASLHLARADTPEEAARDLDVALIHSRLAESHGDTTADHFGYQAELLLRQFQNSRDGSLLGEAGRTLKNIGGEPTVPALAASAELAFNWAVFEIERHKLAAALQFLLQAHAEYSRALDLDQSSGVHAGYLLAKRGRASLMLYRLGVDSSGRHDSAFLERAIEDWLDPRAVPHRHDHEAAEALLNRARLRRGREDHVGAEADSALAVKYLADTERPLTAEKLRADQLDADLQRAERARDIDRTLTLLTGVPALSWNSPIPAAALANGCKLLIRSLPEAQWRPVVAVVLDRVEADIDHPALTAAARSHVAGHAATLAKILTSDDPDEFRRAIALYRRAIGEGDDAAAKTLERAGAIAFELAELLASADNAESEEALGLWTDSMAWSSAALIKAEGGSRPAAFDAARTTHRVGVAALRLFARTRDPALLEVAQRRLAEAPETSHETDTARLLVEASTDTVPPPATVVLRRVGRRVSMGVASATANSQLTITPLDTAAEDPGGLDPIAQAWALLDAADTHPADRSDLLLKVATIAANDADFPSSTLGGQRRPGAQGVRIINDRHRLLEQVLVLKRSTREAAEREHHATAEFTRWLEDHHEDDASARWRLPEPLGVVPAEEDEGTYVMRRHAGRTLGSLLVDWRARAGSDPTSKFIEASRFLAAFQSWKLSSETYRIAAAAATVFGDLQRRLNRAAQTLQLRPTVATRTADLLAPHFAVDSVLLPKKDAHAGNWIWTHHGELVLIDIESTATLPVLLELAALIDDLPLFELDDDGWQQRMSAAATYLDELKKHGVDTLLDAAAVRSQYEIMCLYLAAVGLGRLARKDPGTSSSAARATFAQRGHYESMITYLAKHGYSDGVRAAASGWLAAEVDGARLRAAQ